MVTLKVNPREKEYLTYMLRGMKPTEIAEIMNITVHTACNYKAGILKIPKALDFAFFLYVISISFKKNDFNIFFRKRLFFIFS